MDGNIWATLVQATQMLLVLAVIAAMVLCFLPVIQTSHRLKDEKARVARDMAEAVNTNRRLQQQMELLKRDPATIERKARDVLQLGRPGEVIFRFDPYQSATPVSGAPGAN